MKKFLFIICFLLTLANVSATTVGLNLTVGPGSKMDLGTFVAGTQLSFSVTGNGDLVDSRYQVKPDGSLYATATGVYAFANAGATYTTAYGGDGINHFSGGGANYDMSGSGFGVGKQTTDTTDPLAIRLGAVVGTFVSSPVATTDWFVIGISKIVTFSTTSHLYIAVNDTGSSDNHGTFTVTYAPVPETQSLVNFAVCAIFLIAMMKLNLMSNK